MWTWMIDFIYIQLSQSVTSQPLSTIKVASHWSINLNSIFSRYSVNDCWNSDVSTEVSKTSSTTTTKTNKSKTHCDSFYSAIASSSFLLVWIHCLVLVMLDVDVSTIVLHLVSSIEQTLIPMISAASNCQNKKPQTQNKNTMHVHVEWSLSTMSSQFTW